MFIKKVSTVASSQTGHRWPRSGNVVSDGDSGDLCQTKPEPEPSHGQRTQYSSYLISGLSLVVPEIRCFALLDVYAALLRFYFLL